MNIYLTGYTGFLGNAIFKTLEKNNSIIGCNSTTNSLSSEKYIVPSNLDIIYHTASIVGTNCLFENQLMNNRVFETWIKNKCMLITFGTSASYDPRYERVETNYLKGIPETQYKEYAVSKRLLLLQIEEISKIYNLSYQYFIPSMFYGPGFSIKDTHFIHDIIKKLYFAIKNNVRVILPGTGNEIRDVVYIEDAISTINENKLHNVLNLTGGFNLTIKEYVKIICNELGYDYSKVSFNNENNGIFDRTMGTLKKSNQTELVKGIRNTILYYDKCISME